MFGQGGRKYFFFHQFDLFQELELFLMVQRKSVSSTKSTKSACSVTAARGLAENQSSGSEKNCLVYGLFCIFFTIIITVIIAVILSFVVFLNCLYLKL